MPSLSLQNGFLVEGKPQVSLLGNKHSDVLTAVRCLFRCMVDNNHSRMRMCSCFSESYWRDRHTDFNNNIMWHTEKPVSSRTDCNDLRCGHKEKPTCHSSDPTLPDIIHQNTGANTFKPAPAYLYCSSTLTACAGPHPLFDLNEENNNFPSLCVLHWVTKRINKIWILPSIFGNGKIRLRDSLETCSAHWRNCN